MKIFIIALIVLCTITALTVISSIYMQNTMNEMLTEIKNLPDSAEGRREDFDGILKLWQDNLFRITLIVPHKETDAVETHLTESLHYYEAKNTEEYQKSISLLCAAIKKIKHGEKFSLTEAL